MTAKLTFKPFSGPVYHVTYGEHFLGQVSKDPIRCCWCNNKTPRTYRTRKLAALGLLSK